MTLVGLGHTRCIVGGGLVAAAAAFTHRSNERLDRRLQLSPRCPRPHQRRGPAQHGVEPASDRVSAGAAKRRRDVLRVLLFAVGVSGLLALATSASLVWAVFVCRRAALVAFFGLWVYSRSVAAERRRRCTGSRRAGRPIACRCAAPHPRRRSPWTARPRSQRSAKRRVPRSTRSTRRARSRSRCRAKRSRRARPRSGRRTAASSTSPSSSHARRVTT